MRRAAVSIILLAMLGIVVLAVTMWVTAGDWLEHFYSGILAFARGLESKTVIGCLGLLVACVLFYVCYRVVKSQRSSGEAYHVHQVDVSEPVKLLGEQPTYETYQVLQGSAQVAKLPSTSLANPNQVTEHSKPLDEQPTGEPDQSDQGDSGLPIPQHDKWTRQEWDAIFDWFYGVPRKECQSEKELAARIGREESYVRKQKQLYDNSHDLKGNTQNV